MNNKGKNEFLKELMHANGISDDLYESIMQHGDKLMKAIGLTEEHLAASILNANSQETESITSDSILTMNDNELVNTIGYRLDIKAQNGEALNDVERNVLTLAFLDMEVMNGGLCQFIVNSSGRYLEQVPDALQAIGADEYAEAFCDFVDVNKLDLKALSTYHEKGIDSGFDSFYALLEKYPFSEFDNRYVDLYKVYPLETKIAVYIRLHAAHLEQA